MSTQAGAIQRPKNEVRQPRTTKRVIEKLNQLCTDLSVIDASVLANLEEVTAQLSANIQARTSPDMNISVRFVDTIPLTKSGKFKSVISRVSKN